jgi:hypothetical protein
MVVMAGIVKLDALVCDAIIIGIKQPVIVKLAWDGIKHASLLP